MFSDERKAIFTEITKNDISAVLNQNVPPGRKLIICGNNILRALEMTHINKELSDTRKDVDFVIFGEPADLSKYSSIFYFINPHSLVVAPLAAHLLSASEHTKSLHVYFVPQKTLSATHVLENELGLRESIPSLKIGSFDWDLLVLERDVVVMNLPAAFCCLFADGDIAPLGWVARMLLKLQTSYFGLVPLIRAKGPHAAKVAHILKRLQTEAGHDFASELTSEVDSILILDRTVDLVTPLMTQLTYEGLLGELYNVEGARAKFPFSINSDNSVNELTLTEEDKVFVDIRDRNFSGVGPVLHQKSLWVKQTYDRRKEVTGLRELNEYVKRLPEVQEIHRQSEIHTKIATEIDKVTKTRQFQRRIEMERNIILQVAHQEVFDYIEDLINRCENVATVLRVICLYSVVNNGFKRKDYEAIKQSMMLTYGIPHIMSTFFALERCGLLRLYDPKGSVDYGVIRKSFRTWCDELDHRQPNDCAYAYSGYASLLVRIVELLTTFPESWDAAESPLSALPGETVEIRNDVETPSNVKTTAVFVLGGVASAEISSLRFLQSQLAELGRPQNIMVFSTDVVNGKQLITSVLPFRDN